MKIKGDLNTRAVSLEVSYMERTDKECVGKMNRVKKNGEVYTAKSCYME